MGEFKGDLSDSEYGCWCQMDLSEYFINCTMGVQQTKLQQQCDTVMSIWSSMRNISSTYLNICQEPQRLAVLARCTKNSPVRIFSCLIYYSVICHTYIVTLCNTPLDTL